MLILTHMPDKTEPFAPSSLQRLLHYDGLVSNSA